MKNKKDVLVRGTSLHLIVYMFIAILLGLAGVPGTMIFMLLMVLLWGLFVMGYAFYYQK